MYTACTGKQNYSARRAASCLSIVECYFRYELFFQVCVHVNMAFVLRYADAVNVL